MRLHRDGPLVALRFDLARPPKKGAGLDVVQVTLEALDAREVCGGGRAKRAAITESAEGCRAEVQVDLRCAAQRGAVDCVRRRRRRVRAGATMRPACSPGPALCGYLVVAERPGPYQGVDRGRWEAVDEALYAPGRLSAGEAARYRAAGEAGGLWGPVAVALTDAQALRVASERVDPRRRWEVIGVGSPWLTAHLGGREATGALWGFDVVSVGEWSLLAALWAAEGVEGLPLNARGLLTAVEAVPAVQARWQALCDAGRVEPIGAPSAARGVEWVAVWAVDDGRDV